MTGCQSFSGGYDAWWTNALLPATDKNQIHGIIGFRGRAPASGNDVAVVNKFEDKLSKGETIRDAWLHSSIDVRSLNITYMDSVYSTLNTAVIVREPNKDDGFPPYGTMTADSGSTNYKYKYIDYRATEGKTPDNKTIYTLRCYKYMYTNPMVSPTKAEVIIKETDIDTVCDDGWIRF